MLGYGFFYLFNHILQLPDYLATQGGLQIKETIHLNKKDMVNQEQAPYFKLKRKQKKKTYIKRGR